MTKSILSIKAHSDKCVSVTFDPATNNVITIGFDGTVKFWERLSATCLKTVSTTEGVTAAFFEEDRIFIASSDNIIASFSIYNAGNIAVIAQFLSEVNHMRISHDKDSFLACSSDNSAKFVKLKDSKVRVVELIGHKGPVISVAIDRHSEFVATASCDGSVIVWKPHNGTKVTELKMLDKLKDISQINNNCRLTFSSNKDKILAVPLNDYVALLDCLDWSVQGRLEWEKVGNMRISDCIFSEDSQFLIGGTNDGNVLVWDISSVSIVESWSSGRGAAITALSWYPTKEILLISDAAGYFEVLVVDLKKRNKDILNNEELNEMFEDMSEDLGVESVASTVKDSEEESDVDCEFNISSIKADCLRTEDKTANIIPEQIVQPPIIKKISHPIVRPCLTPCIDGIQLILYNSVGALKKHFDDDGSYEFLEVYFHDHSISQSIIIKSEVNECQMGDVNTSAFMLISNQDIDDDDLEESEKQSLIYVQSIKGTSQTWQTLLPVGESPVGCCLASVNYAIVFTNRGFLRYFSLPLCGMQMYIESIHGTPVAIVSSSCGESICKDQLSSKVAVVVEDGDKLMCRLELISPGKFLYCGRIVGSVVSEWFPLPLSEGSKLVWLGFSNCGTLYSVDSKQVVRRLQTEHNAMKVFCAPRWSPVLNLKEALDKEFRNTDRYFPVGFTEDANDYGALTLNCRSSRFPRLVPWPQLTVIPFKAPLCPGVDETLQLENNFTLLHMIPNWSQDSEILFHTEKQILLKLFINAVTQGSDFRAMSIARLMPDSSLIQLAIRVSVRAKRKVLAERLGELALSKDEEELQIERQIEECNEESNDKENDKIISNMEPRIETESSNEPADTVLLDKFSKHSSPIKDKGKPEEFVSPFQLSKNIVPRGRGLDYVDKCALNTKKLSPKKDPMTFGNFVPSPKTFLIKSKRKTVVGGGSPSVKKVKK